jgi:hypothetical protein
MAYPSHPRDWPGCTAAAAGIKRSHAIFDLVAVLSEPSEARVSQALGREP